MPVALAIAGCTPAADPVATAEDSDLPVLACGDNGRLEGELYGNAIRGMLAWDRTTVKCEGMPRPEGEGVRLRFAGTVQPEDRNIAIIIAMPKFERTTTRAELSANVTLIEEGNGRFYSTARSR